jgi:hypothetical protein
MVGHTTWVIPEGYIPEWSQGPKPEFESHETACILNANDEDAEVGITLFFEDKDPVGPYKVKVPAKRTCHIRFNELEDPAPVPKGQDFASIIEANVPIVVQHTRLDSRQSANALMTTMAFPSPSH